MEFGFSLVRAEFLERPNRFLIRARMADGSVVRAHCADPGRLRELLRPGAAVFLSESSGQNRSTTHDLRLVVHPDCGTLVSVDSRLPNLLFAEAAVSGVLEVFPEPISLRREVPLPFAGGIVRSRLDYLLSDGLRRTWWIEVKSVTLVEDGVAYFPDAVTARGRRHVVELTELAHAGEHVAICFIVQRPDARVVRPAWDRDPAFARALGEAAAAGVQIFAWTADVTLEGISLARRIPVLTDPPNWR